MFINKKDLLITFLLFSVCVISGCATNQQNDKPGVGTYLLCPICGAYSSLTSKEQPQEQPKMDIVTATQALAATAKSRESALPATFNMIEGNTGVYLSPITSDGVAAAWVDKAINAKMGSQIGGAVGAYAGQKALENVPFVGSWMGNKAGASIGKSVALKAVGGEAYIRQTSDISFNNLNDMARWLLANYSTHQKLQEILKATYQIYPDLQGAIIKVR